MTGGRRPRVGDDVLYVSYGTPGGEFLPEVRAAKITAVGAWSAAEMTVVGERRMVAEQFDRAAVALCVFNPTGLFFHDRPVAYHSGRDQHGAFIGWLGGTWHWPSDEPEDGS